MDKVKKYIVIDFDSTFTKVEGLDELAEIALAQADNREAVVGEIRSITNLGMEGKLSFSESLLRRIQLLKAHQSHLATLVEDIER